MALRRVRFRLAAPLLGLAVLTPSLSAQQAPKTGREVIERMHRAYQGTWYRNLTFVQKTTINRGGAPVEQTWYETIASPSLLRIDIGEPDSGNALYYTVDSLIVLRGGKVVRRLGNGNPFLPFVQGAYVQPVEQTLRDIASFNFDLSKTMTVGTGDDLRWVVGTSTPGDTLTPQFWVEPKRLLVTRFIGEAGPGARVDAVLGGYEPVGKAWLATHITMTLPNGTQDEAYTEWQANRSLPEGFMDPDRWGTGRHWAKE